MAQPQKPKNQSKPKTKPQPKAKPQPKSKAAPAHPSGAGQGQTPAKTYTLDSLAQQLGDPDAAFVTRIFASTTPAALVERGTRTSSQNVIDDVPGFAGSALEIYASLSPAQRARIRLPQAIYPALVAEAVILRKKNADHATIRLDHAAGKADRSAAERRAVVAGIAKRDSVYDGLKSAVGEQAVAELNVVVGRADTAEVLAKGLDAVADFIDRKHTFDADTAALLEDFQVGPACAADLRSDAEQLRKAGMVTASTARRVSQRGLDLQDGRVLLLIERILRAFRAANREDATILVPALVKLAWLFELRPRRKGDASEGEGGAPDEEGSPEEEGSDAAPAEQKGAKPKPPAR